eukprot:8262137-Pyramimonas_sp.AAC.1
MCEVRCPGGSPGAPAGLRGGPGTPQDVPQSSKTPREGPKSAFGQSQTRPRPLRDADAGPRGPQDTRRGAPFRSRRPRA